MPLSLKSLASQLQNLAARVDRIAGGGDWQSTSPLLGYGWDDGSVSGLASTLMFRLAPGKMLEFVGTIHSVAAAPGAPAFTLPAGYRPAVQQQFGVAFQTLNAGQNDAYVTTAGEVYILGVASSGVDVYFNARVRMDI